MKHPTFDGRLQTIDHSTLLEIHQIIWSGTDLHFRFVVLCRGVILPTNLQTLQIQRIYKVHTLTKLKWDHQTLQERMEFLREHYVCELHELWSIDQTKRSDQVITTKARTHDSDYKIQEISIFDETIQTLWNGMVRFLNYVDWSSQRNMIFMVQRLDMLKVFFGLSNQRFDDEGKCFGDISEEIQANSKFLCQECNQHSASTDQTVEQHTQLIHDSSQEW